MTGKAWKASRAFLFLPEIRKYRKWRWDFADGSASLQNEECSGDNKVQSNGDGKVQIYIYPLNFALMIFGNNIEKIVSSCTYTDTGVDEQNSITLQYFDGRVAHLNSSMNSLSDRMGIIYGTKGYIVVENINNFESVSVYDSNYKKVGVYKCPKKISGYEYEVEASIRAVKGHQLECVEMPHSETLRVMKIMDGLRKEWGIVYPFEKEAEIETENASEQE